MSKELEALEAMRADVIDFRDIIENSSYSTDEDYNIVKQALKRNEPMKRILHQSVNEKYPELLCPSCFVSNDPLNHYCPKCGQKLDWGSEK